MKRAIIYRSFFGRAKQYAEALRKEIDSDFYKHNQIGRETIRKYDLIVLCSGTYAGWISITGFLKKYWEELQEGNVVLIAVGAIPADNSQSIRAYNRLPTRIQEGIKYFKLPSRVDSKAADKERKKNLAPIIEYINGVES